MQTRLFLMIKLAKYEIILLILNYFFNSKNSISSPSGPRKNDSIMLFPPIFIEYGFPISFAPNFFTCFKVELISVTINERQVHPEKSRKDFSFLVFVSISNNFIVFKQNL